jgi:hypothetical protein
LRGLVLLTERDPKVWLYQGDHVGTEADPTSTAELHDLAVDGVKGPYRAQMPLGAYPQGVMPRINWELDRLPAANRIEHVAVDDDRPLLIPIGHAAHVPCQPKSRSGHRTCTLRRRNEKPSPRQD